MDNLIGVEESLKKLEEKRAGGLWDVCKSTLMMDLIEMGVAFEHAPNSGDPFMVLDVVEFMNHQVDVKGMNLWGKFLADRLKQYNPTKIVTVRSGGIPVAHSVSNGLGKVPYVFASKGTSLILSNENSYIAENRSYTEARNIELVVDKRSIVAGDRVVFVDDFLDTGTTTVGVKDLCEQAGAEFVGAGYMIEKKAAQGREKLVQAGVNVPIYSVLEIEDLKPGAMKVADSWYEFKNK